MRSRSSVAALFIALLTWNGVTGPASSFADGEPPSGIGEGAVVFSYNRFGEDRSPSTSIRIDQFEAHLEELIDDGYKVLPLPTILEMMRTGTSLPDLSVAITIDEASRSAFDEAWPRLRAANLPFTLFVATDALDRGSPSHMTWQELRQMNASSSITIGGLGASLQSLADRPARDVAAELSRMSNRLTAELGQKPTIIAWPRGEYSLQTIAEARRAGITVAFGQQSGIAHSRADRLALPRFVMNEAFGSIDRFRLAANALPLPVTDVTPEDSILTTNPPPLGFTVADEVGSLAQLSCFASGQGRATLAFPDDRRVEVRIAESFPPGRARVNCTLPTRDGRWRWLGHSFIVPEPVAASTAVDESSAPDGSSGRSTANDE